jgi:two-component system, OmpR family, phosphate regulon sensor histidine kinase PhoR
MTSHKENILVVMADPQVTFLLERVLKSEGYTVVISQDQTGALRAMEAGSYDLVVLGEKVNKGNWEEFGKSLTSHFPATPILLFVYNKTNELLEKALAVGVSDIVFMPLKSDTILQAIQNSLEKSRQRKKWVLLEAKRATASLQHRIDELEALTKLGRSINSSLNLDSVLMAVVDAAVQLTGAEEGSLLLLDESTGELYMRAARNFQEEFVRTFRLSVNNTLAGSVINSGKSVLLDENTPKKIKTSYLVHSLIYVPLKHDERVIGVLGVDNRSQSVVTFKDQDTRLLAALAEFAVIAIENARLYSNTIQERNKLETILTKIEDGVLVLDQEKRVMLCNHMAMTELNIAEPYINRPVQEVITHPEVLALIEASGKHVSNQMEVSFNEDRVCLAQRTPIPEVGLAITFHDITYLKKLDKLKSEFVNTVSHDLRSPLTAILGYVDLIERAGPVTDLQRDFIQRVQVSVHNITHLVDELVNLGKIEAGFDTHKENLRLDQIIRFSADSFKKTLGEKGHHLQVQLPEDFPSLFGNPVELRQAVDQLLDNAIKYTPSGGNLLLQGELEESQVILQVKDNGIGIPMQDLPYIFDKFYRASNVTNDVPGTGLGLAIVKSIVENHEGRIWVESKPGEGTTVTVVLPRLEL